MYDIRIFPPEIGHHQAIFRWRVDPPSPLYRASEFRLRFPAAVDLARVPAGLWWEIALICLHSQWPLLRPCRVHLPVTLRPGEAECWLRLLDAEIDTLEAHRGTADIARTIEIIENGPPLDYSRLPASERCATAFSGGKDSLTQAALLCELTRRPIIVPTTSPMSLHSDHEVPRRRQVFDEIRRRREIEFIEVESDYRAIFEQNFAVDRGYKASVNEITDTFLYSAAAIIAGVGCGAAHIFLAAEAQAHENIDLDGRIIQSPYYMCSIVTLVALSEILSPFGVSLGTLTAPLWRYHVQTLLWTRYADLCDLQYSCWLVKGNQYACNRCVKCLVLAARAEALGGATARAGIDWVELLDEYREWRPVRREDLPSPALPGDLLGLERDAQVARDLAAIDWRRMAGIIARDHPRALLSWRGWRGLLGYRGLHRRSQNHPSGPPPGYRAGLLRYLDPLLRERVAAICAEHFEPAEEAGERESLERTEALMSWVIEPLKQTIRHSDGKENAEDTE